MIPSSYALMGVSLTQLPQHYVHHGGRTNPDFLRHTSNKACDKTAEAWNLP